MIWGSVSDERGWIAEVEVAKTVSYRCMRRMDEAREGQLEGRGKTGAPRFTLLLRQPSWGRVAFWRSERLGLKYKLVPELPLLRRL